MGYDLHITRKDEWSDPDDGRVITLEEWLAYIAADPDLELSDGYRIKVPGSLTESQIAPGFCDWKAHPWNQATWFGYGNGCIDTKNPDEEVIKKMLSIAEALGARLQGDDGEIYTLSSDNQISTTYDKINSYLSPSMKEIKPWWKFW